MLWKAHTERVRVQIAHECAIDWLELNAKGTHLLFRDRAARLHLFCVATGERKQLLQFVGYVQWVPDSDVIVVRIQPQSCVNK